MTDARRPDARLGQSIVEPAGGEIAEVVAERLVNRREHLEQDEDRARDRKRVGEAPAALDRADEHAHGDRENRRQRAPQEQHCPPRDRKGPIGLRQRAEKLPFVSLAQDVQHDRILLSLRAGGL